jgi:hypothetical protein
VPSKPLTDSALREHFAELRRALVAGVDTQTERITAEVRALLLESLPPPPEPRAAAPWAWIVACTALAIALASTALWWRSVQLLEGVKVELAELRAQQDAQAVAAPAPVPGAAEPLAAGTPQSSAGMPGTATPTDTKPIVLPVPYGADALSGARLEVIRQVLYRLARQKTAGVADIRTFAGRFCLVGNQLDGYSLAPDETLFSKCDVVGNPSEDATGPTQRTPLALANLAGDIRSTTHGALDVQVAAGDSTSVLAPYPAAGGTLTAGDWNRAASANNRVEIRIH